MFKEQKTDQERKTPEIKMMKGQCMPRLKNNKSTKNPSPMTLLERFREAMLRLMMLSALSKASSHGGSGEQPQRRPPYYSYDPHYREAVADCIEFIKKKAATDENRHSTASSSADSVAEMVLPVSVM